MQTTVEQSEPAHWPAQQDDPDIRIDGRVDPGQQDAYWSGAFRREPYYRHGLDYEDYAPAYCAGYVGYAQYGGRFADAQRCLCANWLRIRGDSRLGLAEALAAMEAAWRHAELAPAGIVFVACASAVGGSETLPSRPVPAAETAMAA